MRTGNVYLVLASGAIEADRVSDQVRGAVFYPVPVSLLNSVNEQFSKRRR